MEGAIKACATLRADLMCAACRVPSMEGQPKNPECRAIAFGRRGLVCGMARVDKLYATCRVSSMEGAPFVLIVNKLALKIMHSCSFISREKKNNLLAIGVSLTQCLKYVITTFYIIINSNFV